MKLAQLMPLLLSGAAACGFAHAAAISDGVIRIGVLNDRSGPYAELSGEGSVLAAPMAADQFGNKVAGVPDEIIAADHQNKTDLATSIARKWFDTDGVDIIVDVSHSGISLSLANLVRDRKKLVIHNSGAMALTGKDCNRHSIQYMYNIAATASSLVTKADVGTGLDTFFIISVDYAVGHDNARLFRQTVAKAGGKVLGEVKHPVNTSDFSAYLLQAQASGAKGVLLANSGGDLVNASKQASEFGISPAQTLLASAAMPAEIEAAGPDVMRGLRSVSFYEPNLNDKTRAWAAAFSGGRHRRC